MHLHSQKIGRRVVVAAHSHREGRSPPGRWSWKVKDRNNQFLEVIIFSLSLSLSLARFLSPRIVVYIEEIDSAEERRGGATQRSLNPGKEGPRDREEEEEGGGEERPAALPRHVAGRGAATAARLCGENGALFKDNHHTSFYTVGVVYNSRARGCQSCLHG